MNTGIKDLALRLQAVIDTAIDGIITIDHRGTVETMNRAAAELFEYEPEDVIGRNVSMLMPDPYQSRHDGYISRYKETREARIIGIGREVLGLKKNGEVFPFRLAVSEVILNDRVIFTGIVHDMTQIKKAEEALRISNENLERKVDERTNELEKAVNKLLFTNRQLEHSRAELEKSLAKEKELNELKSRFVSMASHEFRTPLSTIMSSASIISRYKTEAENEKRLKHVGRIKSAVDNLTGILNDFLSLSKLEENKVEVKYGWVHPVALLEEIKNELEGILKEGQFIRLDAERGDVQLETDERILKNILFNLLSNAVKYSPPDEEIVCRIGTHDSNLVISVTDRGIGIPEQEQKYLFDRFFRASNAENIQGTGLGLNIVQRYVQLLNGALEFKSSEGQGSTFTLRIPAQKQSEK